MERCKSLKYLWYTKSVINKISGKFFRKAPTSTFPFKEMKGRLTTGNS